MFSSSSRRDFLRATAGSAGMLSLGRTNEMIAEALAAPVARAAPRLRVRLGEPTRIGVVGTGGMGTGHLDAFIKLAKEAKAEVQIAALADVCQPRLEAAKAKVEEGQGAGTVEAYYADYP